MNEIMQFWVDVGFMRWPLAFSLMAVIGLALMSASTLFGRNATAGFLTKTWIDAILFWGGFASISGVLGSIIGVIVAFQAIEMAGEVHATLVAGGIKVAVLSSGLGVTILALAALVWFSLQFRWRVLQANELDGAL